MMSLVLQWRVLDEKISISRSAEYHGVSQAGRDVFTPGGTLSYSHGGAGTTPVSLIARRGIAGRQPLMNAHDDTIDNENDMVIDEEAHPVQDDDKNEEDEEDRIVVGVEQLKREVDFLLGKKARLERDTGSLKDELDLMGEQKRSARKELSELMYDMESARRALESLHVDMEKEQEEFMVGHRKMLSTMDLDLEEKKSMVMKRIALEKKDATEREREVETRAVEVDARMKELHASEEELAKAREALRVE